MTSLLGRIFGLSSSQRGGRTRVIADDEPFMRAALRDHLRPELQVVAEAGDGDGVKAVRAPNSQRPSVAFLDIRMHCLSGLQVAQLAEGRTQVVFVTA